MSFLRPGSIVLFLSLLCGGALAQGVTCPDGFAAPPANLYTGFCYKYITRTQTWNAHENECSQVSYNGMPYAGGHLATLFDANSAMVVMNNYCNNLNQGQSHYFVGYYCISSSYSSRLDWRWTSGKPTTWIHQAPTYLSGAEPDDAGCGRAHYSDDGANTGRIGDWACSSPLSGGCCEAPVVPTPSASTTGTQTASSTSTITSTRTYSPTNTATSTVTASSTQTGTQTGTVTMTRTGSKTSTETRTATSTSTGTSTATSSETPSSSASVSQSVSESVSVSASTSVSVSVSPSVTISTTATVSPSISATGTRIRVMVFPQSALEGGGGYFDENGFVSAEEAAAAQEASAAKKTGIVAGGAIAGGVLLCCCLAGLFWFCVARRRRQEKERRMRERMNRKSHIAASSKIKRGGVTSVASTLGVQSAAKTGPAMMSMFNSMNPALVRAKRGTMVSPPIGGAQRGARMTMALAAYKNTSAFKPTMVTESSFAGRGKGLLDSVSEEIDDAIIGIQEEEGEVPHEEVNVENSEEVGEEIYENNEELAEEVAEEAQEELGEEAQEEAAEEDDYVDEDDPVAAAAAGKVRGRTAESGGKTHFKQKKTVETAAQPLEEPRKLVIGRGAVVKEHVQKQTVMLRRVSKVRGDKELTALRQETVRFARPSVATRGLYEPQASHRNLLGGGGGGGSTPYAFTATVSRVLVKEEKDRQEDNTTIY